MDCFSSLRDLCDLRGGTELMGAATQKVKPRRVAANEAGAERVSNRWFSALPLPDSCVFVSIGG